MKYVSRYYTVKTFLFILILSSSTVFAEQDRDTSAAGGLNVSVSLKHRVVIPKILYFRIGSETAISKVTFDIANSATFNPPGIGNNQTYTNLANQLGNSNPIEATSNGTMFVDLRANVGTVTLSYTVDNSNGLADGSGHFIPFDQILTVSDDGGLPAPVLVNSASNTSTVNGNFFSTRVIKRTANWTYTYKNELTPAAGTYNGRITYTASSP